MDEPIKPKKETDTCGKCGHDNNQHDDRAGCILGVDGKREEGRGFCKCLLSGRQPESSETTQENESATSPSDPINSPAHYKSGRIEAIDVIEAFQLGYKLGNVIKYVLRHAYKGEPLKDLMKARWYLDRAIKEMDK